MVKLVSHILSRWACVTWLRGLAVIFSSRGRNLHIECRGGEVLGFWSVSKLGFSRVISVCAKCNAESTLRMRYDQLDANNNYLAVSCAFPLPNPKCYSEMQVVHDNHWLSVGFQLFMGCPLPCPFCIYLLLE